MALAQECVNKREREAFVRGYTGTTFHAPKKSDYDSIMENHSRNFSSLDKGTGQKITWSAADEEETRCVGTVRSLSRDLTQRGLQGPRPGPLVPTSIHRNNVLRFSPTSFTPRTFRVSLLSCFSLLPSFTLSVLPVYSPRGHGSCVHQGCSFLRESANSTLFSFHQIVLTFVYCDSTG